MEVWNIVVRCVVFAVTSDPFAEHRLPEQLSALVGGWTFRDGWRSASGTDSRHCVLYWAGYRSGCCRWRRLWSFLRDLIWISGNHHHHFPSLFSCLQLSPDSEHPKVRWDLHLWSSDKSSSTEAKRTPEAFRVLGSSLQKFLSALSRTFQRAALKVAEPASAASPTARGPGVHELFLLNPHGWNWRTIHFKQHSAKEKTSWY